MGNVRIAPLSASNRNSSSKLGVREGVSAIQNLQGKKGQIKEPSSQIDLTLVPVSGTLFLGAVKKIIRGAKIVGRIGAGELILILVIALVIFGPAKLPEIGKAVGRGLREFKSATKGLRDEVEDAVSGKKDNG